MAGLNSPIHRAGSLSPLKSKEQKEEESDPLLCDRPMTKKSANLSLSAS
jgi:hypothetical protein